jgi:aquaporin NIP
LKSGLAEFIGTFALVFAGTGALVIDSLTGSQITHLGIALTFGLVVMSMIYAVGDVSGAHLNPAVTLGFFLARRLPLQTAWKYVAGQIAGAVAASLLLHGLFPTHLDLGATHPTGPAMQSFWLEILLTAILMFVILRVSTGPKERGLMAGIAIGGVIAFEALFAGPISGASMNPARSLAPALVTMRFEDLWIYLLAPPLGAAVAVPMHMVLNNSDR